MPVHDEPDGIKFEYEVTPFIFGAPRSTPPPDSLAQPSNPANGDIEDIIAFNGSDDDDAAPDFLAFEDEEPTEVRLTAAYAVNFSPLIFSIGKINMIASIKYLLFFFRTLFLVKTVSHRLLLKAC